MVALHFNEIIAKTNRLLVSLCLVAACMHAPAHAQIDTNREGDFAIDYSDSTEVEAVEIYGAGSGDLVRKRISLRSFTPPVGDMGNAPVGQVLGWAFAYYAPAIAFHLKPSEILSPYFLFDMLTKTNGKCQLPKSNYIQEIQRIMMETGCLRKVDYAASGKCVTRPDLSGYRNAPRFRIVINRILSVSDDREALRPESVLFAIRKKLDANMPVVALMKADKAFRQLGNAAWQPNNDPELFSHAVVIVGYDDFKEEIEVVSPWGNKWGNSGFGRIKYQNLTYLKKLYQISEPTQLASAKVELKQHAKVKPEASPARKPATKPTAMNTALPSPFNTTLFGIVGFRRAAYETSDGQVAFENLTFKNKDGVYQSAEGKVWGTGDKFQLVVSALTPNSHLYIFSVDPSGKVQIHWPKNHALNNTVKGSFSSLVSDSTTSFVVPRPKITETNGHIAWKDQAFVKTKSGPDYLVILHSSEQIDNEALLSLTDAMVGRYDAPQFATRLKTLLGNKLIKASNISSESGRIRYAVKSNQGYVLPLILEID